MSVTTDKIKLTLKSKGFWASLLTGIGGLIAGTMGAGEFFIHIFTQF